MGHRVASPAGARVRKGGECIGHAAGMRETEGPAVDRAGDSSVSKAASFDLRAQASRVGPGQRYGRSSGTPGNSGP